MLSNCPIRPQGSINEKWLSLGAGDGPLGCPTNQEAPHPEGGGARIQDFQHGQIAWTPGQGDKNAQAGWMEKNRIVFDWGPTDPFNYDKFLVRWDKDSQNLGQDDVTGNRTRGRWSTAVRNAGLYKIYVEGCHNGILSSATCEQGWSKPVDLNYVPPAPEYTPFPVAKRPVPPPVRTGCNSDGLGGYYLREYWHLGGIDGPMGCFQGMDGKIANFQNGQISVSEDSGDQRVLAAYQEWDGIAVDWWVSMDNPTHTYNKFLVRWDRVGVAHSNRDQVDVMAKNCDDQAPIGAGCLNYDTKGWDLENGQHLDLRDTHLYDRGSLTMELQGHNIPTDRGPGDYTITVRGCNVHWPGSSDCPQSWFLPVKVTVQDKRWWPQDDVDPGKPQPKTVDEAKRTIDDRTALGVVHFACHTIFPHSDYRDEVNYTMAAQAKLAYADYFDSDRCPGAPDGFTNRAEVIASLMKQGIGSVTGTTYDPLFRIGEYDAALAGLVRIIYKHYAILPPNVLEHVLFDLLNKTGGPDDSDHWVVPPEVITPGVPESENHIWQIESSRYLTNQLLYLRTGDAKYDNARNGLEKYVLERLGNHLRTDFIEYNARPYQDYTSKALMNLFSYAKSGPVKTAAQMVLDYISLKVAVSSSDMRRSVPYRRRVSTDWDDFLGGGNCGDHGACALDINAARGVALAGTTDLLYQSKPDQKLHAPWFVGAMTAAGLSDYRIPDAILDLIINRDHREYVQAFHHYSDELYAGSPSFTINAGGQYATFAYPVGPFHDSDDAGLAVPTVLLPTGLALPPEPKATPMFTSRNNLLRFNGATDNTERSNKCVTQGFACGLNPVSPIPDTYLKLGATCHKWADAAGTVSDAGSTGAGPENPWAFFDQGSDGCNRNEWRYYVAFYRNGDYGFLEALDVRLNPDVKFDNFVGAVLANNKAARFNREGVNTYVKFNGDRISFTFSHDSRIVSAPGQPNMGIFASGTFMNTVADGKHVIRNPATGQTIVLDDSNMYNPVRIETSP